MNAIQRVSPSVGIVIHITDCAPRHGFCEHHRGVSSAACALGLALFAVDEEKALCLERDEHFVWRGEFIDDSKTEFGVIDGIAELKIRCMDIVWARFAIIGGDFWNEKCRF